MNEQKKIKAVSIGEFLKKAFAPAIAEMEEMATKRDSGTAPTPSPEPPALCAQTHWRISNARGYPRFFIALIDFVPTDSSLQIEGNPYPDVEEGLRPWLTEPSQKTGRFWRTLAKYVLPVTIENMSTLARLAENHAEPEVADHFAVLCGGSPILHWYDAPSDPIYVSGSLDEGKVARFATTLGGKMKKEAGSTSA
jgi:hypothetical protein